jgi:hypothetical protein
MLNKTDQVGYTRRNAKANIFSFLNICGIFRMVLQRVWQTAYNRLFRVRQIIVRIYFHIIKSALDEPALEEGVLSAILLLLHIH